MDPRLLLFSDTVVQGQGFYNLLLVSYASHSDRALAPLAVQACRRQSKSLTMMVQVSMSCLLPSRPTSTSNDSSGTSTLASLACTADSAGLLQEALRVAVGLPQPCLLSLVQVCIE